MKSRAFLKLIVSVIASLGLGLAAATQAQPPHRVDVLIGFVSPPLPEDVAIVQALGGQVRYVYSIVPAIAASVPEAALRGLARDQRVRYIEEDAVAFTTSQTVPWGIVRVFGDEQYSFPTWTTTRGEGVGVAILDTGIDPNHPDLTVDGGRRFYQQGPFLRSDNNYSDGHGHGTHVAGTVAALDNGFGVVGVAPAAKLYAVKVLDNSGRGSASTVAAGIQWAVQQGIPILNMSLGFGGHVQTVQEACAAAYAAGHVVVASAGNSGNSGGTGDNVGYPAAYASVIAVAASDVNDQRASFSSTGPEVELIAPGVGVYSTLPNNSYGTYSGTSMASPHVAGVAALVWAAEPGLNNLEVRGRLQGTAQDLGLSANHQGRGLVRADLAVRRVASVEPPQTYTITATAEAGGAISPSGEVTVNEGANQTFTITPTAGYQIANVSVDGSSVGAVSSYTFSNVTDNHTIHATFADVPVGDLLIDEFNLTNTSNPAWARVLVQWTVSGGTPPVAVQVTVGFANGSQQSQTFSASSGSHEFSERGGHGSATVTLTASDASSQSVDALSAINL